MTTPIAGAARIAALACLVALAACGGAGSGEPIEHPTGADELVLSIETGGGFVPVEVAAAGLPSFVLLGDGRAIVQGPVPAIFPGPALPNLQERRLTETGVQAILSRFVGSGLFEESYQLTGAANVVADAPTTTFTLRAGGREATVSVYALGIIDAASAPGIDERELEAHRSLGELSRSVTDLDSWLPDGSWVDDAWRAHEPDALRVYVRPADAAPADENLIPGELEWPLEVPLAEFAMVDSGTGLACGVAAGDDARLLLEALRQANQLTRWLSEDEAYSLTVRPLLPHEEASC
jgi:hypothetical protein